MLNKNTLKQFEGIKPGQISDDSLDSLIRSYLTLAQGRILKLVRTRRIGSYLNKIKEKDIESLSQVTRQLLKAEYLLDSKSPNRIVLDILSAEEESIQSIRQENNFDELKYNLDLILKSVNAAIKLLKLKTIRINENSHP